MSSLHDLKILRGFPFNSRFEKVDSKMPFRLSRYISLRTCCCLALVGRDFIELHDLIVFSNSPVWSHSSAIPCLARTYNVLLDWYSSDLEHTYHRLGYRDPEFERALADHFLHPKITKYGGSWLYSALKTLISSIVCRIGSDPWNTESFKPT